MEDIRIAYNTGIFSDRQAAESRLETLLQYTRSMESKERVRNLESVTRVSEWLPIRKTSQETSGKWKHVEIRWWNQPKTRLKHEKLNTEIYG